MWKYQVHGSSCKRTKVKSKREGPCSHWSLGNSSNITPGFIENDSVMHFVSFVGIYVLPSHGCFLVVILVLWHPLAVALGITMIVRLSGSHLKYGMWSDFGDWICDIMPLRQCSHTLSYLQTPYLHLGGGIELHAVMLRCYFQLYSRGGVHTALETT